MRRVVVTGLGAVSCYGLGVDTLWQNLLDGRQVLTPLPDQWTRFHQYDSQLLSPLPDFDYKQLGLRASEITAYEPLSLNAILATREALQHANITVSIRDVKNNTFCLDAVDRNRAGVFIGSGIAGVGATFEATINHCLANCKRKLAQLKAPELDDNIYREVIAELNSLSVPFRFNMLALPRSLHNSMSAAVGIKFGIHGPVKNINSACSAGNMSIGTATDAIKSGSIDFAIAGSTEYVRDPWGVGFRSFDTLKTLACSSLPAEQQNRPFDRDRSGFVFGQGGTGVLILEELNHAIHRGAPILAEIIAYGETFDGHSILGLEKSGANIRRLIYQTLDQARLTPSDVDYINGHGTGTQLNDEVETACIEDIFGETVLINSTKSLLGHTFGASGGLEGIVCVMSILKNKTHICNNLENPIRDLNFVRKLQSHKIDIAYSHSFGFGGQNAALIFSRL